MKKKTVTRFNQEKNDKCDEARIILRLAAGRLELAADTIATYQACEDVKRKKELKKIITADILETTSSLQSACTLLGLWRDR